MKTESSWLKTTTCALGLAVLAISSTGCQVSTGGQVLPSPHYYQDDIQYFAPGSEFKLHREATKLKQFRADQNLVDLGGS